ncbi:MAG TPA: hypothetical protein VG962_09885 [Steroidobacteraceae bacterium]|nr:hypothetical protein [Steroidobacteraceae bacterium]
MAASGGDVEFKSLVSSRFRKNVEELLYFNSGQTRVLESLIEAVERFGAPEIVDNGQQLKVVLRKLPDAQTLFAVAETGRPLGLMTYLRSDHENLLILHVSISAEFASGGALCRNQLLLRMLREIRRCSRRLKGIKKVELYYQAERQRQRRNQLSASLFKASHDV